MERCDSFGEWLRQRRRALDLTQAELGQCAGYSVSALRKVEADERRPSRQVAALLAQCLQIPPEERPMFVKVARGVVRVEKLGVSLEGLAQVRPRAGPTPPTSNLPVPATPLIGREPELAALVRLLGDPQCRLLTIVGPGGIGKTRLAIEVASALRNQFPDGVYFVPLVSLASPQFIAPTVGDVLGFEFSGPADPYVQLLSYLRGKSLLLLLDNFEHLLEAGVRLAELLRGAPGVKLLVTSRERLDLKGEWLFDLQGLPVPPPDQAEWAEEYSAVELFVQRARHVRTGFVLEEGDREAVSRICQQVDGMPLAIELAAAWTRVLPCEEIASEIERSVDFLASSARDVPERHHSLRAIFDHSWNLLSAEERGVLSRLAVFRGGFERGASEQVAGASLSSLSVLVSKSLVRPTEDGRYHLHQVVRQYALARLADDLRSDATRDRHCDCYLGLLRDREGALRGANQSEALRELTKEIDNLRAAWAWAVGRAKFAALGQALRCFAWLHEMRGWFGEGIEQVERVVQALRDGEEDGERKRVLGQALAQQGLLLFRQGQFARAQSLFEESLDILRPIGDPSLLLDPLTFGAIILFLRGETDQSQSLVEECLTCSRAADEPWFTAYALFNQGYIASLEGRYEEGYNQMLAGLAGWRALRDARYTAMGLNHISPTAIHLGRYAEAQAFLEESLALCTQVGDRWGMGTAYRHLGLLALAKGDPVGAQTLLRESLGLFEGFVTGWDVVQSLVYLADAEAAAGDSHPAERSYLDAHHQAVEVRAIPLALDALVGLASLCTQTGDLEQALELSIRVSNHPATTKQAKGRAERLRAQLESQMAPQWVKNARVEARALPLEGVLEMVV